MGSRAINRHDFLFQGTFWIIEASQYIKKSEKYFMWDLSRCQDQRKKNATS